MFITLTTTSDLRRLQRQRLDDPHRRLELRQDLSRERDPLFAGISERSDGSTHPRSPSTCHVRWSGENMMQLQALLPI